MIYPRPRTSGETGVARLTIGVGLALILVGALVSILSDSGSFTSWIPAFIGVVLLVLGIIALVAESATKLVMHIAIAVAALAVLASLGSAIGRGSTGWALASQILTIVLCGTLVLFAIRSFLTARRSQPQDGLTSG